MWFRVIDAHGLKKKKKLNRSNEKHKFFLEKNDFFGAKRIFLQNVR